MLVGGLWFMDSGSGSRWQAQLKQVKHKKGRAFLPARIFGIADTV
jgi:hypothetical protein